MATTTISADVNSGTHSSDLERLSGFKIFQGLAREQIASLLDVGQLLSFDKGDLILEECSQSTDLFIIMEGRVDVEIMATQTGRYRQKRKRLAILRIGDVFGEMAFLERSRRSASVAAFDSLRVLKLDHDHLQDLFNRDCPMGYRVMRNLASILAQRLTDLNFMWRDEI